MKRSAQWLMAVSMACALFLSMGWVSNAAAQSGMAKVSGRIVDLTGRPGSAITITFRNSATGQSLTASTNNGGQYTRTGLPPGNYTVTLTQKATTLYEFLLTLTAGQELVQDIDFKKIQESAGKEDEDAAKKAAEAKAKFNAMKQHFDAGMLALQQAKDFRTQMDKLPRDQQASVKSQLDQASGVAVTEIQAAIGSTEETDANRNLLLARLGEAYEADLKYTEAAEAYTKAVALRPDPGYYNNLGNCLARTGKVDDALAAYKKAIELDPMNTAMYWSNFSIGLYNTGRIKESVEPLRQATAADPKNAQTWYLLGAALVNTMDFKKEGDNLVPVLQPGTIEAYQKSIELDPSGPYAAQAKQGLEALQAMGIGISTKVNQPSQQQQQRRR